MLSRRNTCRTQVSDARRTLLALTQGRPSTNLSISSPAKDAPYRIWIDRTSLPHRANAPKIIINCCASPAIIFKMEILDQMLSILPSQYAPGRACELLKDAA